MAGMRFSLGGIPLKDHQAAVRGAGYEQPRVPLSEATQIAQTARADGTPVWFLLARDEVHNSIKKRNEDFLLWSNHLFSWGGTCWIESRGWQCSAATEAQIAIVSIHAARHFA
jgi:hypothetical protein